ncbi:MAG: hypothetical protein R3251_00450, partial [Candidatus Spechtbacterales bacterium]|nr:hypothetical protein [Candidatus Spechtbacterales bacterium]
YRYSEAGAETDVGTATCGSQFTDGTTNVQFTIGGNGSVTGGDAYSFMAWKGATDANTQKTLQFQQDADTLTVGAGETLELKGQTSSTSPTIVNHAGAGTEGYSIISAGGTIDFNGVDFDEMGGTGQTIGVDLQAGTTVTEFSGLNFDNYASAETTAAYVGVVDSVISANSTFTALVFDNTTSNAVYNVNLLDTTTCTNEWLFQSSGTLGGATNGETNDNDDGDGSCGSSNNGALQWEDTVFVYITAGTYNNLEIHPGSIDHILGTAGGQTITSQGYAEVGDGTTTGTARADTYDTLFDIQDNFLIDTNATFIASSASSLSVAANWTNNGTFNANSGTVEFDDASKTTILAGATTFYNFLSTAAGNTLNFTAS